MSRNEKMVRFTQITLDTWLVGMMYLSVMITFGCGWEWECKKTWWDVFLYVAWIFADFAEIQLKMQSEHGLPRLKFSSDEFHWACRICHLISWWLWGEAFKFWKHDEACENLNVWNGHLQQLHAKDQATMPTRAEFTTDGMDEASGLQTVADSRLATQPERALGPGIIENWVYSGNGSCRLR